MQSHNDLGRFPEGGIRGALVAQVGAVALTEVQTANPAAIRESLGSVSRRSDKRLNDLYDSAAALGGQTMTCVDIVLGVETAVQQYIDTTQRIVPEALAYERHVPGILKALVSEDDKTTHANLESVWLEFVKSKYGPGAIRNNRIQVSRGGDADLFNKKRSGAPAVPKDVVAGRRKKNKSKKTKWENSGSLQASRQAAELNKQKRDG